MPVAIPKKPGLKTRVESIDVPSEPYDTRVDSISTPSERNTRVDSISVPSNGGGLLEKGNIDENNRPMVIHPGGDISTVYSMTVPGRNGGQVNIPTVSDDGRMMTEDEAMAQYRSTGRHLGRYDTPENAVRAAKQTHESQAGQHKQHYRGTPGHDVGVGVPTIVRRGQSGNGGQPPAEEVMPPVHGLPADPYTDQEIETKEREKPVEPSLIQPTDIGDLGKLATISVAALAGKLLGKKVAEKVLPRLGAEGLTGIRNMQAAVKAGDVAPESLAAYARKLLGREIEAPAHSTLVNAGHMRAIGRRQWDHVANKLSGTADEGLGPTVTGDFLGSAQSKPLLVRDGARWPGPATNAGAHGQVPVTQQLTAQFKKEASEWLTNVFPQQVTGKLPTPGAK